MRMQRGKTILRVLAALMPLLFCAALPVAAQQPVTARYIYDQNGRLRAVVTPEGAAIYDYDPAGNFTAIRRLGTTACEAIEFTPRQGPPGTLVTIYGVGFNGQVSQVTFNGVEAQIVPPQTPTSVTARVPDGATTGPIAVSLPCGTRTFATQFTVSGVMVLPTFAVVLPGRTIQFTAKVAGVVDPGVRWSIEGGGSDAGAITENGFYTAPAALSSTTAMTFIVRATVAAEPSIFGEAMARVTASGSEIIATGVAVRYGDPPNNVVAYAVTPISVRYDSPPPPTQVSAFAIVSVTQGPAITSVAPATVKRGAMATLTINGANFWGAAVRLTDTQGATDPYITVSNLIVNASGTVLTVTVSVNADAALGRRVVSVTTAAGSSLRNDAGSNAIEIVP